MNEKRASAEQLVRSVLAEAFTGGAARVLNKYHLLDETGNLRTVTVKYPPGDVNGDPRPGPIIMPDVIERFLALDPSNNKRVFDWMMFAAGGGEPHKRESERALDLAKNWVVANRMKGEGRNDDKIKPMTRQEAEADWMANDFPKYNLAYFFADQDLAGDVQYPVFGWFRDWPGRKNVYEKVVQAVGKWQALASDKKFIQAWNRSNPKEPFQMSLWKNDETPLFKDVEAMLDFVGQIKATMARRKAETNVVTVGRNPEGGFRTGSTEVFFEDDFIKVVIPLTAAASLKHGYNNWCISNHSRWEDYFRSRNRTGFMWGAENYTGKGPFAFMSFKKPTGHDDYLQMLAAHVQLDHNPNTPGRVNFWDKQNTAAIRTSEIIARLQRSLPAAVPSFKAAMAQLEEWLTHFKREQLERFPALEAMAQQLAASLLAD